MRALRQTGCAVVLALAGCGDVGPGPDPVVLSYPYVVDETVQFDGFERVAQQVSGTYVRVVIHDKTAGRSAAGHGIVNGASGCIVDPLGYVVTAAHIAKSTLYGARVTTIDGRVHQGTILHVDPMRELALLKIEPFPGMQVAAIADTRALRVGQWVLSIGTPNNRKGVVSLGKITNPRRDERIAYAEYGYNDAIELQMEVEPGHSGGPVFDTNGHLVGIVASFGLGNTRRVPYVSTRIAYAVPSAAISAYLADALAR